MIDDGSKNCGSNPSGLELEDLAVGQIFRTGSLALTAESIKAFATEYDPQPMHVDEDAAAAGPFGQLTASGWQTLALAMKLMAEAKPFGDTPLLGVGVDEIRFLRPVTAGATIEVQATVTHLRRSTKPGRGFVKLELEVLEQPAGAVVLTEIWTVMVPSRRT